MRILIYKRTHDGDPDYRRQFGIATCMGQVRGYRFDAVIGIGGISGWPKQQGISGKLNWLGRNPQKSYYAVDTRGPLVSFGSDDFRLFEQHGPPLASVAPLLAKKLYGSGSRYLMSDSLNPEEKREAESLIERALDLKEFDHMQLISPSHVMHKKICRKTLSKVICRPRRGNRRC